ncbi:MAG: hypothetical protein ABRQ37_20510, partial [Candidatus Eremiobacterota bacterium]
MYFKTLLWIFLISLSMLGVIAGCGSDSTVTPVVTVTPVPTSTPTPIVTSVPTGLPSSVTELTFSGGKAGASVSSSNVVAVYNKSDSEYAYTLNSDIAVASLPSTSYENVYYRGGEKAEKLYERIRRDTEKLYKKYGRPKHAQKKAIQSSDYVGQEQKFWVVDSDDNDVQITATLKAMGAYCYVYVDNTSAATTTQAQQVVNEWEGTSYPTVLSHFGEPTDVDGDDHIYILLSPALNNGGETSPSGTYGYFYSRDQYPGTYSNYKDIIYLNSAFLVAGNSNDIFEFFATLPHEFQHMVNFNYKGNDENTTFNEGCSMISEMYAGYGLPNGSEFAYSVVKNFEINPVNYSITEWYYNKTGYGISFLFMCYINDQYGSAKVKQIVSGSSNTGPGNIANVVGVPFETLYKNWVIANQLDGVTGDAAFIYTSIDMAGTFGDRYYNKQSLPGIQTGSLS